jgi:hypothetical protein
LLSCIHGWRDPDPFWRPGQGWYPLLYIVRRYEHIVKRYEFKAFFDESDIDRRGVKGILGAGTAQSQLVLWQPCRLVRLDPAAASLIVRHNKISFGRIVSDEKQDF